MILQRFGQYPPPSPALMKGIGAKLKGATGLEKAYRTSRPLGEGQGEGERQGLEVEGHP
jgi:hypothetical protein